MCIVIAKTRRRDRCEGGGRQIRGSLAMSVRFLSISLMFLLFFMWCGSRYDPVPPKHVTIAKIDFAGVGGHHISTNIIYSVPQGYTPKKAFPVVIALHGSGSNAAAFHDLWKTVTDTSGFVLLTPQGEEKTEENIGWRWGENAERSVLVGLDILRKAVHVDPKRIYIVGFSSGGRLAYYMGLRHSNLFKGIAALGAPVDKRILSEKFIVNRGVKVYIGHGSLEGGIAEDTEVAVKKFRELGVEPKYVRYEGIGHSLPDPMESEMKRILDYLDSGAR